MVVMVMLVSLPNSQGGGCSAQTLQNNLERSGTDSY
jgi:hypothetical protein